MGGAVSSGRDNNELVDNLISSSYIRTRQIERVFRVLDRADYMTPEARDQAYRDLAWRNGPLHLSAPCIYSEVMEGLELRPGISFLNIGSGTGYLSTLAGLIIGAGGISHGIEVHPIVVEYATLRLKQFIENSPTLDEFDFCEPKYFCGNGLCLAPLQAAYDRVYCGAGCPEEYHNYMKQLIKVGGILVMPLNDNLIQMRRLSETEWSTQNLHHVSFAALRVPTKQESSELIKLDELTPPRLQVLARGIVRTSMRNSLLSKHPELREPPPKEHPARPACPRRICIPIEDDSDVEGLNALHDLDRANGANEMNALLSLVLSMGHNRVAGALRFDTMGSHSESSSDDDEAAGAGGGGDGGGGDGGDDSGNGGGGSGGNDRPDDGRGNGHLPRHFLPPCVAAPVRTQAGDAPPRSCRGVLTLEFQDTPQPTVNLSRQPPDILINNTNNATVVASGFTIRNKSSMRMDGNTSTATDSETRKPDANGTANAVSTNANNDSADANVSSSSDTTRTGSIKSKITITKSKLVDTKSPKKETKRSDKGTTETENGDKKSPKQGKSKRKLPAEVEIYLAGKSGSSSSYKTEMEWEDTVEIEIESSDEDTQKTEDSKESKRQKVDSGIGEETSPTSSGCSPVKIETNEDSEMDVPSDSVSDKADAVVEGRSRQQKRGHGQLGTRSCSSSEPDDAADGSGTRIRRSTRRCKRRATPAATATLLAAARLTAAANSTAAAAATSTAAASATSTAAAAATSTAAAAATSTAAAVPTESTSTTSGTPQLMPGSSVGDMLSPSATSQAQSPDARRVRLSIMMKRGVRELPLPYALKKYINYGRCFQF